MFTMKNMYSLFFCLLGLALFYNGCTNPDSLPVNPNDTDSIYEEIYDPAEA